MPRQLHKDNDQSQKKLVTRDEHKKPQEDDSSDTIERQDTWSCRSKKSVMERQ